jgi:O-antigen biosynthesis protein
MQVLITHLQLHDVGGSESYTETLVRSLVGSGHRVSVYTPVRGPFAAMVSAAGGRVFDTPAPLRTKRFDVVHAQHNVTAVQVRSWLPEVPMLFHSHGTMAWPEQPPPMDLGIARFVAVSELVEGHLVANGVPPERVRVLHNAVDCGRYVPGPPLRDPPRRAVVLSNKIDPSTLAVISEACHRRGIALEVVGRAGRESWDVRGPLQRADIVFSLGRGVLEAMACARAAFVYDVFGADGWVTPVTVRELETRGFSGKRYARQLAVDELEEELSGFRPAMGPDNRQVAEARYDMAEYLPRIIGVYEETIADTLKASADGSRLDLEAAFRALPMRFGTEDNREGWLAMILKRRRSTA